MAVGARDQIDQLLVKKYATEKVDNHEQAPSLVEPAKMLEAMNDYAQVHMNMIRLQNQLSHACRGIVAKNAKYRTPPRQMANV